MVLLTSPILPTAFTLILSFITASVFMVCRPRAAPANRNFAPDLGGICKEFLPNCLLGFLPHGA